jgi:hypothetical protein
MATQKQIDANRNNAKQSTGPRSEKGKSVTRLNAKRDGFTGQVTTLSDQDRPVFEKFKSQFIADLAPKTVMELSLATSIAWDTWRLNHLRAVEMNMYALGTQEHSSSLCSQESDDPGIEINAANPQIHTALAAAVTFANDSQKFALMSIYEQRMNRSIHKNLETLRNLQAERKINHRRDRSEEVLLARYSEIKGLPYQAPAARTANGSVFSNNEILAAANRLTTLKVAKFEVAMSPLKVQYAGASAGAPSNVVNWPKSAAGGSKNDGNWPSGDAA